MMREKHKITPEMLYEVRDLMSASIPEFKAGLKRLSGLLGIELTETMSDAEAEKLQIEITDRLLDMILEQQKRGK